jgi:inward rectifier potassium channel
VHIDGFDPVFSNTVIKRTSYTFKEIIHNAKFKPMYHMSKDGSTTVLELNKLNAHEKIER